MNVLEYLLKNYPDKHWNWGYYGISNNPNITMEIIKKFPDKPWGWAGISENPNITMEIIEKYPNKPWDWEFISLNRNITMEMIEKYPNKSWNWRWISENPNITIEMIEKYIDKIYFEHLSSNIFTYETKRTKKKESYWLLEEAQAFNKTENLVILSKYM